MQLTDQDVYDISEHLISRIQDYIELYDSVSNFLPLEDFLRDQVSKDLTLKYTKYQVEEAFEDRRLVSIMNFYIEEPNDGDHLH